MWPKKAPIAGDIHMKWIAISLVLGGGLLAFGGEIAQYHSRATGAKMRDSGKSRTAAEVESTSHGISEIGIERTGCFGTCPEYTFIARSDGTFRYKGVDCVERKGEFTGRISLSFFHQLAQFIRDSGYLDLEPGYALPITDHPSVCTMVVMNGKRKTVRNYANAGPTKLWAIEELIDDMMRRAIWNEPANGRGEAKSPALNDRSDRSGA
jgi:hypothetical protein